MAISTIPRRIGFYTLRKHALALCKYVPLFKPIIMRTYPNNTLILTLLDAVAIACAELVAEIDNTAEPGV